MTAKEIRELYAQGEDAVVDAFSLLLKRIESLEEQVEHLRGQLRKDSSNSSKPPSSDGFKKKTKSLRRKSGKKSGAQPAHPGHTLDWSSQVDWIHQHRVSCCSGCGLKLDSEPVIEILSRQVFEIPAPQVEVSEHQVEVKYCPSCGQMSQAEFPAEASSLVQYGPRLKALMVYLMDAQLLPSGRTRELLQEVFGVEVCEGTLYNSRDQCVQTLDLLSDSILEALVASPVVHFDETGMRVNGQLWWLHVAATSGLTYYFIHPKRGQAAMNQMGILPTFSGKAVHDGLKSYADYGCDHFLCNAHHLRELQFMFEHHSQVWAFQMSLLLMSIYRQVQVAKEKGQQALPPEQLKDFTARYQDILEQGFKLNPAVRPPPDAPKKRGRPKQTTARNFLQRLSQHQESVLGFMYDFSVPFDNNQAERDLRMMKLKQKISGCFRSAEGAKKFCRIRGYLSTLRKQGHDVLNALTGIVSGNPQPLLIQPE